MDHFTSDSLQTALGNRQFRVYETIGSTQDIAREWALAESSLPGGSVVIAEQQTAGRGRQGRPWYAPAGSSIMFSVVLRPHVIPEQLPRMMMVGGVAVAEGVAPLLPGRVALKWPNDVLVEGRKLSGILAETTWMGNRLDAVILGIGLNVRVDFTGTEMASYATSLEKETGERVNRHKLLAHLLDRIDYWTLRAQEVTLLETYRGWLRTLGKRVMIYPKIDGAGDEYPATAEDVDDNGALIVRLDSGEQRRVLAADVGLLEA
jgi:BirA family transcriptional regulator, biotin operon repressor / biotin---[acetyl-CoA-carboxylase] ligase